MSWWVSKCLDLSKRLFCGAVMASAELWPESFPWESSEWKQLDSMIHVSPLQLVIFYKTMKVAFSTITHQHTSLSISLGTLFPEPLGLTSAETLVSQPHDWRFGSFPFRAFRMDVLGQSPWVCLLCCDWQQRHPELQKLSSNVWFSIMPVTIYEVPSRCLITALGGETRFYHRIIWVGRGL